MMKRKLLCLTLTVLLLFSTFGCLQTLAEEGNTENEKKAEKIVSEQNETDKYGRPIHPEGVIIIDFLSGVTLNQVVELFTELQLPSEFISKITSEDGHFYYTDEDNHKYDYSSGGKNKKFYWCCIYLPEETMFDSVILILSKEYVSSVMRDELEYLDYEIGDVNHDYHVDAKDYLILKRVVLGTLEMEELYRTLYDVNFDGQITAKDYLKLKRFVLGTLFTL